MTENRDREFVAATYDAIAGMIRTHEPTVNVVPFADLDASVQTLAVSSLITSLNSLAGAVIALSKMHEKPNE